MRVVGDVNCSRGVRVQAALRQRMPQPGLVHHSDRGTQYMHAEYLRTLRKHGMIPSVGRPASPGDNASCESFFRTLKREEVDAKEFRDLEELRLTHYSVSSIAIRTKKDFTPLSDIGLQQSSSE